MNGESRADSIQDRKDAQLEVAARPSSLHAGSTGFQRLRLRHRALPGRDLSEVSLETEFLGARLAAPLLVSSMTGGTERARAVNARLAHAAAAHAFGIEPLLTQSAYFRQPNRDRAVAGLYHVGAGTHPGGGIPADLLTAEVTAGVIEADLREGRPGRAA